MIGFLSAVANFPFPHIFLALMADMHILCMSFAPCYVLLGDDLASLSANLHAFVPLFSHLCVKIAFMLEIVLALCHMIPFWKARCQLHVLFVCRTGF